MMLMKNYVVWCVLMMSAVLWVTFSEVQAQAQPIVTSCNLCSEQAYQAEALSAAPSPNGGEVHVVDFGHGNLSAYMVLLPIAPGDPTTVNSAVPDSSLLADFTAIEDYYSWLESGQLASGIGADLADVVGVSSVYDLVNNSANQQAVADQLQTTAEGTSYWQGLVNAMSGVLGNHAPDVPVVYLLELEDGSTVQFESEILVTQNGAVVQFKVVPGTMVDADGNTVHELPSGYNYQSGSVGGPNRDRLVSHLETLGWYVESSGGEVNCTWSCDQAAPSLGTCTLTCVIED